MSRLSAVGLSWRRNKNNQPLHEIAAALLWRARPEFVPRQIRSPSLR